MRFLLPAPLLLLASLCAAQDFARESIEMMPGLTQDQRATLYRLDSIMQGDIDEVIDGLVTYYQSQALQHVQ